MTACHVFIDEISRVRHNKELYPGVEDELMDSYRHGLNVMSLFAQEGKLMREFASLQPSIFDEFDTVPLLAFDFPQHPEYQLSKVHDSFAAI